MFAKMSGHITPKLLCNFKIGLFNISSFLLGTEVDASVKPWSSNPILNIPYIFGRRVEGSEGTSALALRYLVINILVLKLKPSTDSFFLREA